MQLSHMSANRSFAAQKSIHLPLSRQTAAHIGKRRSNVPFRNLGATEKAAPLEMETKPIATNSETKHANTEAASAISSQDSRSRSDLEEFRKTYSATQYPYIDLDYPGLEMVNAEPPVFVVHDFLTPEQCAELKTLAATGALRPVAYNDAVLFDYNR